MSGGVFTDSSGVFVMLSGSTTWFDRSDANMHYWVKDLVVDPHDTAQNIWYVGIYGGWGGPYGTNNQAGGLYKTTNRGQSWTRLIQLPRVSFCAINPNDANELYMTTETDGLWYCNNLAAGTPTFSQVTAYPFRHPERVFFNPFNPNEIWVTSFGNGMRVGTTQPTPVSCDLWIAY